MTRIGILSDTHLPDSADAIAFLLDVAENCFADAEMILHAGDVVAPAVLDVLSAWPVYAVRGNMDPPVQGVPVKRILEVEQVRIGLMHGWGAPHGLEQRLLAEFKGGHIDCLVYGHSHRPLCQRIDDVLLFNPGSATDRRSMPFHSVGLLTVEGTRVDGEILRID